jgi:hypothetical protein
MAAPEAAFKDVPEIFEVCFLRYHVCLFRTSHRSNWENPSSREPKLLVCIHESLACFTFTYVSPQPLSANSVHRIFVMSSKAPVAQASAM